MAYQPKSYKKFVATAATATLVASAIAPAASAAFSDVSDRYQDAVDYLAAEKIAEGYPGGKFGTNDNIKRQDAAVMIAKALGATSTGTYADAGFTDVRTDIQWAVNFLKEKGIVDGKAAGQFGANEFTTREEMSKIIANAYKLVGDDTNAFPFTDVSDTFKEFVDALYENGITEGKDADSFGTGNVTRGEFALFIYRAEGSPVVNPETPEVVSVSATNLKTVTINFSTPVDEDTIDIAGTDATVKAMINASTSTSVASYNLSEDGMTLTLEVTGLNQSDTVKVWVDGLETTDGVEIPAYETSVTVTDTAAPVIQSVEVVNHKVVKFHFSEAVNLDTAGIFKTSDVANSGAKLTVDGNLVFAKFTALPEEHAVEVEFFNSLTDGNHELVLSEVKDFAGFKTISKTFNINTVADVTAPLATSVEYVSPTSLKVNFTEALKGSTNPTGTFVVKEAGNSVDKVNGGTVATLSADKKSVTLTGLTALTAASIVGYDVTYKNVEDIFGNKVTTDTTISSKVEDDSVKPTVSNVSVLDGNVLQVTFSEKVSVGTTDFVLYKEDGKTLVASSATGVVDANLSNPDYKTYKVSYSALTNIDSDNFVLKVQDATDLSIRSNEIVDQTISFIAKDSKAPSLVTSVIKPDATGNNDKIELVFSEAMNSTLLADASKYFVGNGSASIPLTNIAGAKVDSVSADGKKVVLLIPDADNSDTTGGLTAAIDRIAAPSLKDTTGNLITNASIASPVTVAGSYTTVTGSDLEVVATGKNTVEVNALNGFYFTSADANAFKFERDATDGTNTYNLGVIAAQLSADSKTIVLTTSVPLNADATFTDAGTKYDVDLFIDGTNVKDQNGNTVALAAAASINVGDEVSATQLAPVVKTGTTNTLTVAFDEAIASATGITVDLLASAFDVKVAGNSLTPVVDYTASVNGSGEVELVITKAGVINSDVTVELVKPAYLVDTVGNGVNALAVRTVTAVTEQTPATVTAQLAAAGTITANATHTLRFSEALNTASKTAIKTAVDGAYTANGTATVTSSWNAAGTTLTVSITAAAATNDVVLGSVANTAVTDLAGNTSAALNLQQ